MSRDTMHMGENLGAQVTRAEQLAAGSRQLAANMEETIMRCLRSVLTARCTLLAASCLLAICLLIAAGSADAAGNIVGPQKCEFVWDQTATNTDGTPLTDLLGWRIYVTTTPGQYTGVPAFTLVNAASPAPTAPIHMAYDCKAAGLTEGQKYAVVRAVDQALNESTASNESPFVWDAKKPSTPTGFGAQ